MPWYFFAFLAPALWALSNHIDKYILSRYLKNGVIGALVIFGGIIGFIFSLGVFIFVPHKLLALSFINEIIIVFNGALLIIALIPYYYALSKDETSIVTPLYQTIPIFSYLLGFFILGERISPIQIFAGFLIIIGALIISLNLDSSKIKIKKDVFFLMMLSSFLVALYFLIFKFVAIHENFWGTTFWEYIGVVFIGIFLFIFIGNYRRQFLKILKENSISIISINGLNEVITIGSKLLVNYASILAPLALVTVANGFQPFFVFLYGILLTLFFPSFAKEKINKKYILQKSFAIIIMFIGMYLLIFV